jgi:hypothetical protein
MHPSIVARLSDVPPSLFDLFGSVHDGNRSAFAGFVWEEYDCLFGGKVVAT